MLYIYPLIGLTRLISNLFNSVNSFMYNLLFTGFGYEVIEICNSGVLFTSLINYN